ncbi:MAG: molybdopterin-guanine dinucleotide biosynthesis protein B [Campylobacter sp.]|nr:molybdopterin-guanine dinucleotide biosynthesis protein B [Campylobacter sp.]
MKRLAVAFSGPSNTGKTTLILKVAKKFINDGLKVVILKHDPGDKAKFDVEGKDSFKFSSIGADVVVASPTRTTYFSKTPKSLDEIAQMLGEFDLLIVEGLKTLNLPRISLFRDEIDESYFKYSDAIATNSLKCDKFSPNLDINNEDQIYEWIKQNAKRL